MCMALPEDAPATQIQQHWPLDSEPNIDGMPPSDVIELISERVEEYLFSSQREEQQTIIAWVRAHDERLDAEWAQGQIDILAARIATLQKLIPKHPPGV